MIPQVFSEKHASDKREKWVTGNFHFFRMHRITDIYFVGGFGTLQWVNVDDYINAEPDLIVLDNPDRTIQVGGGDALCSGVVWCSFKCVEVVVLKALLKTCQRLQSMT